MNEITINSPHKDFESIKKVDEQAVEYWEARELMPLLGYETWRNFEKIIKKAIKASEKSEQSTNYHFVTSANRFF